MYLSKGQVFDFSVNLDSKLRVSKQLKMENTNRKSKNYVEIGNGLLLRKWSLNSKWPASDRGSPPASCDNKGRSFSFDIEGRSFSFDIEGRSFSSTADP